MMNKNNKKNKTKNQNKKDKNYLHRPVDRSYRGLSKSNATLCSALFMCAILYKMKHQTFCNQFFIKNLIKLLF